MRYFRYPLYGISTIRAQKLRFKNLDKQARKNVIKNKAIIYALIALYFILLSSFIILIKYLDDIIENPVSKTLMMVGMVLATIIVPIAVVCFIFHLIRKSIPPVTMGELILQNIQDITAPLKKYYNIHEPLIVTKCYKCPNESFNNKDVMIFYYEGNIRITVDLNHTIKDKGCYEFNRNEFTISYVEDNGLVKASLKTDYVEFLLGKRAVPFIRKCFKSSK